MNTKHTRLEMEMLSIIEEAEKHSRKRLPVKKATWLKMVDIINRAQTEESTEISSLRHLAKYGKNCDVVFIAERAISKAEGK